MHTYIPISTHICTHTNILSIFLKLYRDNFFNSWYVFKEKLLFPKRFNSFFTEVEEQLEMDLNCREEKENSCSNGI